MFPSSQRLPPWVWQLLQTSQNTPHRGGAPGSFAGWLSCTDLPPDCPRYCPLAFMPLHQGRLSALCPLPSSVTLAPRLTFLLGGCIASFSRGHLGSEDPPHPNVPALNPAYLLPYCPSALRKWGVPSSPRLTLCSPGISPWSSLCYLDTLFPEYSIASCPQFLPLS